MLANGVNADGAFVQSYGSDEFDASLLLVPLVGFLPPDDRRVVATIAAIEDNLLEDGFVRRYLTTVDDGVSGSEGAFLMCSFWLADNYALMGRLDDATALFERLVALCNDVGLLAEEYDPKAKRMLGNFPQAFSHVSLVNTAGNICAARERADKAVEPFPGTTHRRTGAHPPPPLTPRPTPTTSRMSGHRSPHPTTSPMQRYRSPIERPIALHLASNPSSPGCRHG